MGNARGSPQRLLPRHSVRLFRRYGLAERKSTAPLRRLLHSFRLARRFPNLWQRSRAVVSGLAAHRCWAAVPANRHGRSVAVSCWRAYGLLSIAYRFFVVILILSFHRVLRRRLDLLAHAILAATVVAMLGVPAAQAVRNCLASGGEGGWRLKAALLAARWSSWASVVPLPCRVRAPRRRSRRRPRLRHGAGGGLSSACRGLGGPKAELLAKLTRRRIEPRDQPAGIGIRRRGVLPGRARSPAFPRPAGGRRIAGRPADAGRSPEAIDCQRGEAERPG